MPNDLEHVRTEALEDNTAQGVFKHLRALEAKRERVVSRWVWELLQNARDVVSDDQNLTATFQCTPENLTFCHNGRPFTPKEVAHLIYYGSTKHDDPELLGQFGSGFLTTHLLSPTVNVSGQIDDERAFEFKLDRTGQSVGDLQKNLNASWHAFKNSLALNQDRNKSTTFRYSLNEQGMEAALEGIDALTRNGPYVMVFSPKFGSIQIKAVDGKREIVLLSRNNLAQHIEEVCIQVSGQNEIEPDIFRFLVSQRDGVAVAVPFDHSDKSIRLKPVVDAPRLFLGFPLIGTEQFRFPAVVQSSQFNPTEDRDGVYLGIGDNDENENVVQQACGLVHTALRFAAKSKWENACVLARVPAQHEYSWADKGWLRNQLRSQLIDPIRELSVVVTDADGVIAPLSATFPIADEPEGLKRLWALAADIAEFKDKLPKSSEAQGWCDTVSSWADVCQCRPETFEETIDGRKLAQRVQATATLDGLKAGFTEETKPAEWLNRLHHFLKNYGFAELLRTLRIVPDQTGRFRELKQLHRDRGIPEELKDIANLVGWDLRKELRDNQFTAFDAEPGAGDRDSDQILSELKNVLHDRMEEVIDDDSKKACVRLFAWIVENERWNFLRGYPAFSDEGERSTLIKLERHEDAGDERPLAPIEAWPIGLKQYADLFPRQHTLAGEFAPVVDPITWTTLEERRIIRSTVLYSRMAPVRDFLPDELVAEDDAEQEVDHKVLKRVAVTDVAFLTKSEVGVMARVPQSRARAALFWEFITKWLIDQDEQAFEKRQSECAACEKEHTYFPAAWLVPIVKNKWIRLEDRQTSRLTARSLARLIGQSDWPIDLLSNARVVALLSALRIRAPELSMEIAAGDNNREALDETLSTLFSGVGHDLNRLGDLASDIRDDPELFAYLAERREHRDMARENQRLGGLVECLVRQGLEQEGFNVKRTGIGSDFAIELANEEELWLVEVKSTREDSVRMSKAQAREAVARGNGYFLCVVPLSLDPADPDIEQVRECVRFVAGIGPRLEPLCARLGNLEQQREDIIAETDSGLRLVVDSGSPRFRVDSTVWDDGHHLEELLAILTTADAPQ